MNESPKNEGSRERGERFPQQTKIKRTRVIIISILSQSPGSHKLYLYLQSLYLYIFVYIKSLTFKRNIPFYSLEHKSI